MNILLKYPTRGRPAMFLETLSGWLTRVACGAELAVLVSLDTDDDTMTKDVVEQAKRMHKRVQICRRANKTKIEACNADIDTCSFSDWDIVLLVSDDMICCQPGWDIIVRESMRKYYPDTDGALWFNDGRQVDFNTIECVGRKRYKRFGYLYHPSYDNFFCDLESTDVGLKEGKLVFIEQPICRHDHPQWTKSTPFDSIYWKCSLTGAEDKQNYMERKAAGFP